MFFAEEGEEQVSNPYTLTAQASGPVVVLSVRLEALKLMHSKALRKLSLSAKHSKEMEKNRVLQCIDNFVNHEKNLQLQEEDHLQRQHAQKTAKNLLKMQPYSHGPPTFSYSRDGKVYDRNVYVNGGSIDQMKIGALITLNKLRMHPQLVQSIPVGTTRCP